MNTVFDIFKKITRFDIQTYLTEFTSFILTDYQKIVSYYQNGTVIPSSTIETLNNLYSDTLQLNDLFGLYSTQLSAETAEMWDLLDAFELTKITLLTLINSARWLRSTKNNFRSNVVSRDYILQQGQSLERLATEIGYSNADNDWVNTALNNDVKEEDYSFEGGNKLKITFVNNLNFFINTVIDSISGIKIYGLDLDRALTFENNDFKTLDYHDTIIQQTQILLGLVKGSVPEFPEDGVSKDIIGGNINSIQYPVIIRQLSGVFEKDDRYKSIAINSFKIEGESLAIDLQIVTKLNDVLNEQLVLQS